MSKVTQVEEIEREDDVSTSDGPARAVEIPLEERNEDTSEVGNAELVIEEPPPTSIRTFYAPPGTILATTIIGLVRLETRRRIDIEAAEELERPEGSHSIADLEAWVEATYTRQREEILASGEHNGLITRQFLRKERWLAFTLKMIVEVIAEETIAREIIREDALHGFTPFARWRLNLDTISVQGTEGTAIRAEEDERRARNDVKTDEANQFNQTFVEIFDFEALQAGKRTAARLEEDRCDRRAVEDNEELARFDLTEGHERDTPDFRVMEAQARREVVMILTWRVVMEEISIREAIEQEELTAWGRPIDEGKGRKYYKFKWEREAEAAQAAFDDEEAELLAQVEAHYRSSKKAITAQASSIPVHPLAVETNLMDVHRTALATLPQLDPATIKAAIKDAPQVAETPQQPQPASSIAEEKAALGPIKFMSHIWKERQPSYELGETPPPSRPQTREVAFRPIAEPSSSSTITAEPRKIPSDEASPTINGASKPPIPTVAPKARQRHAAAEIVAAPPSPMASDCDEDCTEELLDALRTKVSSEWAALS